MPPALDDMPKPKQLALDGYQMPFDAWADEQAKRTSPTGAPDRANKREKGKSSVLALESENNAATGVSPKRPNAGRASLAAFIADPARWREYLDANSRAGRRGCRIWLRAANKGGYGVCNPTRKPVTAHRLSWAIANGRDPGRSFIRAVCGNRRCIAPAHLAVSGGHTRRGAAKARVDSPRKPQDAPRRAFMPKDAPKRINGVSAPVSLNGASPKLQPVGVCGHCGSSAVVHDRDDGGHKCLACGRAATAELQ